MNSLKWKSRKKIVEETVNKDVPSYVAPPLIPTDKVSRTSNRESIGRLAAGKKAAGVAESQSAFPLPKSKKIINAGCCNGRSFRSSKSKKKITSMSSFFDAYIAEEGGIFYEKTISINATT